MRAEEQDPEDTLVERAQADPRAFAALYDRYVLQVYRAAARVCRDHQAAQEITAQVFHRALEALPGYRWRGAPFGAWLHRITANLLADHFRRQGRTVPLTDDGSLPLPPGAIDPLDAFLATERRTELWQAVSRLTPLHARALTLRYGQGLSTREVSRILNRSETATKQLVHRALKELRGAIDRGHTREEGLP